MKKKIIIIALIILGTILFVSVGFYGFRVYRYSKIPTTDKKTLIFRLYKALLARDKIAKNLEVNIAITRFGMGKMNIYRSNDSLKNSKVDLWPKDELKFDSTYKQKLVVLLSSKLKLSDTLYSIKKTTRGIEILIVKGLNDSLTKVVSESLFDTYFQEKEVKYFDVRLYVYNDSLSLDNYMTIK